MVLNRMTIQGDAGGGFVGSWCLVVPVEPASPETISSSASSKRGDCAERCVLLLAHDDLVLAFAHVALKQPGRLWLGPQARVARLAPSLPPSFAPCPSGAGHQTETRCSIRLTGRKHRRSKLASPGPARQHGYLVQAVANLDQCAITRCTGDVAELGGQMG